MPEPYNIQQPPHFIANELIARFSALLWENGVKVDLGGRFHQEAEQLVSQLLGESEEWYAQINTSYKRFEDMSPDGQLRLWLQEDGDVIVEVYGRGLLGEPRPSSVEFCCPGSGGGQSTNTRKALVQVMQAMELDNKEYPQHRGER